MFITLSIACETINTNSKNRIIITLGYRDRGCDGKQEKVMVGGKGPGEEAKRAGEAEYYRTGTGEAADQ